MNFYGYDKRQALANCTSCGSALQAEHLIDALDRAPPGAGFEARQLAGLMARASWRVEPASGPARPQLVSNVRKLKVSAGGRVFLLHCTDYPLRVERIGVL